MEKTEISNVIITKDRTFEKRHELIKRKIMK